MKNYFVFNLLFLCFFNPACGLSNIKMPVEPPKSFSGSQLPAEPSDGLEINFTANYGMSPGYKKITVKSGEISVESNDFEPKKKQFEKTVQTIKITQQDLSKLYQTFVLNEFDTIKNDERKDIVYDAPSEGIFIKISDQLYFQKGYGDNEPMSGENLKRYQTIRNAIFELAKK